ncbi:uncharacterized protein LOC143657704 isoform X2 [Tamandua tetradactyla]|uniref:uncharacterized protein LOC143657704 isoform X2 n=1 Tax=Tamandua tetradactyla TaxID=48850 RepID=UPI004053FB5F
MMPADSLALPRAKAQAASLDLGPRLVFADRAEGIGAARWPRLLSGPDSPATESVCGVRAALCQVRHFGLRTWLPEQQFPRSQAGAWQQTGAAPSPGSPAAGAPWPQGAEELFGTLDKCEGPAGSGEEAFDKRRQCWTVHLWKRASFPVKLASESSWNLYLLQFQICIA